MIGLPLVNHSLQKRDANHHGIYRKSQEYDAYLAYIFAAGKPRTGQPAQARLTAPALTANWA